MAYLSIHLRRVRVALCLLVGCATKIFRSERFCASLCFKSKICDSFNRIDEMDMLSTGIFIVILFCYDLTVPTRSY